MSVNDSQVKTGQWYQTRLTDPEEPVPKLPLLIDKGGSRFLQTTELFYTSDQACRQIDSYYLFYLN